MDKMDIRPLLISRDFVERVPQFKFLGIQIKEDLTWSANTTALIKAQQRLHFLRTLRKTQLRQNLLVSFYCCSIESILTYYICVWFVSYTVAKRRALHGVINTVQKIIGCPLPSLEDLYCSCRLKRAYNIL